jgi:hypothetical protein
MNSLNKKDDEIRKLQDQVSSLSEQLATALQNASLSSSAAKKRRHHPLSPHTMNIQQQQHGMITAHREKLGRNASITTQTILDQIAASPHSHNNAALPTPVVRIMDMFQNPSQHLDYLKSNLFAKDLLQLAHKVRSMLEREPRVVFVASPAYVFGDIHGNLEDLHFFSDNVWRLGMSLTAGNFLFLGAYPTYLLKSVLLLQVASVCTHWLERACVTAPSISTPLSLTIFSLTRRLCGSRSQLFRMRRLPTRHEVPTPQQGIFTSGQS